MRSRVAPLTMPYWGETTKGAVLLDSLREQPLFPQFDHVRWHRWLADGSAVVLDGERLYRVLESGEARVLVSVGRPHPEPRLSPDGRWVAVGLGRSIAFISTDGGRVKRLPQPGWVHSIGWHPDSTRLALSAGNRIRVATLDGDVETLRVELTARAAEWGDGDAKLWRVPQVEWSADGRMVAYRLLLETMDPNGEPAHETRLFVVGPRGEIWDNTASSFGQDDGQFSWALGGHVVAWTGTGGDVHSACFLWTPHGSTEVVETGTEPVYYRTAWQPRGDLLAIEETYSAGAVESFGAAGTFQGIYLRAVAGIPRGNAREDGWPEFEWTRSGSMFVAAANVHARVPDQKINYFRLESVGMFATATDPAAGTLVQVAAIAGDVSDVQWAKAEHGLTYIRQLGGRTSRILAAPIPRGAAGLEGASRWLARGKRWYRRARWADAALCFRNAVRCEPYWAEPRVRLAHCYTALSEREPNPACAAWLLWGAEWEMLQARRRQRLSDESDRFWNDVSARRAHICETLGIALPEPSEPIIIRKPDTAIEGER